LGFGPLRGSGALRRRRLLALSPHAFGDLSAKGDDLTITGFSASAAELIKPIDASPLFSAPEFASPVVRVPGQDGEHFTISAKIGAL